MICPRWTPRATAALANLGGSSRRPSCRHVRIPRRGEESGPRRWYSTTGGGDEDGFSGLPSRQDSRSSGRTHRASSRSTAGSVEEQTPHHLPKHRTKTAATRTADAAGPRRHWADNKGAGGDGDDAAGDTINTTYLMWPLLKRRERAGKHGDEHVANAAFAIPKPVFAPRRNVQNPQGTSDSSGFMLVIDGLSPNLSATDFYRIAPNDFSNWRSVIQKVQQQRKPDTLEPLGRYWVTFSTGEAAVSYRDRLIRLHRLNNFKLRSASGLWESSVPSSLKISLASPPAAPAAAAAAAAGVVDGTSDGAQPDTPGTESIVELANSFTLAPGSQAEIPIHRQRVTVRRPWAKRLAGLVDSLGSVLMVDVYPPTLTAEQLHQFISRDGYNRALRWKVSVPQHLQKSHSEQGSPEMNAKGARKNREMDEKDEVASGRRKGASLKIKDREAWETMRGRFVLACADEEEARRFQQSWNQRALTTLRPEPVRYIVRTSMIHW